MRRKFSLDQQTNNKIRKSSMGDGFSCSRGKFAATVAVRHNFPSGLSLIESPLISVHNFTKLWCGFFQDYTLSGGINIRQVLNLYV